MLEQLTHSFNYAINYLQQQSTHWFIEVGTYICIGALFGFICKYYMRYLFVSALITILTIWCLEYFSIISIRYDLIHSLFGSSINIFSLATSLTNWVQTHFLYAASIGSGFLIGLFMS